MAADEPYLAFRCPGCDHVVLQDVELPSFDETADYRSDARSTLASIAVCDECEAEYVIDITAEGNDSYEREIRGHRRRLIMLGLPPQFEERDDYEFWLDDDQLDDPYRIFLRSSSGLMNLAKADVTDRLERALFTMLYANSFAILEAYLCDRLVSLVTYNEDVLKGFLSRYDKLGASKIPLQAVLGNPRIVYQQVDYHLKALIYHKFADVEGVYKAAFGIDVFPDAKVKRFLEAATEIRHDCVHRNGRDKTGAQRDISPIALSELSRAVSAVVQHIERALDHPIKLRRFYFAENPEPNDASSVEDRSEEEMLAAIDQLPLRPAVEP